MVEVVCVDSPKVSALAPHLVDDGDHLTLFDGKGPSSGCRDPGVLDHGIS